MGSNSLQVRQADAVAYVQTQKWNILSTAQRINPRLSTQDLEDLIAEGYAIALEIVATHDVERLKAVFWAKLQRSVWEGYDHLVDYIDMTEEQLGSIPSFDLLEKVMEDERLEAVASSILDFLAPAERRVFCLVLGLTAKGYCHDREAAQILGITRFAVRTMLTRILAKIEAAVRCRTAEGLLVLVKRNRGGAPPRSPVNVPPDSPLFSSFGQDTPRDWPNA